MRHNKPRNTTTYLKLVSHGHPIAQKDGKVYEHRFNLYQKIGGGNHKCHHCGNLLTWGIDLLVDHIDSDKWNNCTNNLVPSCKGCNSFRNRWPNYFTHFKCGHERINNSYFRPDGNGSSCSKCIKARDKKYVRKTKSL